MKITNLLRENIKMLKPYSCARDEFKGVASVYLDANESPFNSPYNRYPDPLQLEVKKLIAKLKGVRVDNIFLGNGSDEPIDLLYRAFCEPRRDNVVAIDPTYGMYKVCADINDVEYRKVQLNDNFDIDAYRLIDSANHNTKIIWLCSPNNPTGNSLNSEEILKVIRWFRGIVVVDEAYIDFSKKKSLAAYVDKYPNLVVLQTLSKAWGNAAIRLGMAFASEEIIQVLNKIKYPYNISLLTQEHAKRALMAPEMKNQSVEVILEERKHLVKSLQSLSMVHEVYPSDANFVLVRMDNADMTYNWLVNKGIIVRNRSNITLCGSCLRITVGMTNENMALIEALKSFGDVFK